MHQQILIFTFTSQMLVLHYKSHSSSPIIPFHYFFPESSLLFPEHFLFFLHSIMFLLPWFQFVLLVILCSQPSKSIQDFATCTVMDGTAALVFLNVPSEFMFVDGSRSWILTLGLHFDLLFVSKIPVRVVFLYL